VEFTDDNVRHVREISSSIVEKKVPDMIKLEVTEMIKEELEPINKEIKTMNQLLLTISTTLENSNTWTTFIIQMVVPTAISAGSILGILKAKGLI
jgi:hypothetical protein